MSGKGAECPSGLFQSRFDIGFMPVLIDWFFWVLGSTHEEREYLSKKRKST